MVSIIVPVYNSSKWLNSCIDSLVNQTYRDIEVVLLDDGSTDDSFTICQQYASKYDFVKADTQSNSGPQLTRGNGAEIATGEWITYVDNDDTLPLDAIEHLVSVANEDTDIVVGFPFDSDCQVHSISIDGWRSSIIKSDPILCTPWGKLFRHSAVNKQCFENMPKEYMLGEDMVMNICISFNTDKSVVIVPWKIYNYNEHGNNLSLSYKWKKSALGILYDIVKSSIPYTCRQQFMPQLIENRLGMLHTLHTYCKPDNSSLLSESAFIAELNRDIEQEGYKLRTVQCIEVSYPDKWLSYFLVKTGRKLTILKEFVERKFKEFRTAKIQ